MWLLQVLFFIVGSTITIGEIFDVTTVYDLNSASGQGSGIIGRVYAQTNALGLPLLSEDGKIHLESNSNKSSRLNLTCDPSECSWVLSDDWSVGRLESEIIAEGMLLGAKTTSIGFKVGSETDYNYYIYIEDKISSRSDILLGLHRRREDEIFSQCSRSNYKDFGYEVNIDTTHESYYIYCKERQSSLNFNLNNDLISLKYNKNTLFLAIGVNFLKSFLFSTTNNRLYFTLYETDSTPSFQANLIRPVMTTSTPGAVVTSPLITLIESDILCLSLVLWSEASSDLELMAEDVLHSEYLLMQISFEAGWNIKQVRGYIQQEITRPFRLIMRSNSNNLSLAGIYPCDPEGLEVFKTDAVPIHVLWNQYSSTSKTWTSNPALFFKATSNIEGLENKVTPYNGTNKCQNGGVWTTDGCACFPGFAGTHCQKGCGHNRFGLDCSGSCSFRNEKCKGKLLCNHETGCHCAPGFYSETCDKECNDGTYGNDCKQTCGHCRIYHPCDIYTGECQECEPGYTLPYCKQAYVYYASSPELSSTEYGSIRVKFSQDFTGFGDPVLYQIQYKELPLENSQYMEWNVHINKEIPKIETASIVKNSGFGGKHEFLLEKDVIEEYINGLKTGYLYAVRVVLMDTNFNKYDGDLIQSSEIVTKCDMPSIADFKINTTTGPFMILLSWSYTNATEHWCPITYYEVSWKENGEWKNSYTVDLKFMLSKLLPNLTVPFVVRPKTHAGYGPSLKLVATTQQEGSSRIRDLRAVSNECTKVEVSWNSPQDENRKLFYNIQYECVQQPACPPGCTNMTESSLTTDQTSVILSPLLPFAQYRVTVTPDGGPGTTIFAGTAKSVPTEVPLLTTRKILRTNTSLTVSWDPPTVCTSFLLGYNYNLYKQSDLVKILGNSFTKRTNASFHNLTASTDYVVRVFVVTTAGWNPDAYLDIITSTSATVPEAVKNLTVYKRSRSSLGVRWAAPGALYGTLKTFTVAYSQGSEAGSYTVEPTPCVPWPQLYCYTLQSLWPNRKYTVTVSARNSEVTEDGAKTSVIGTTKESPPSAPEGLLLTNCTDTSISMEWRYPELANGIIRSFLVSVEETEQFYQDSCCQIFPLIESPVQEEQLNYKAEVPNLHPASTYFVSVSAKTVGLGPAQSLVVQTKPPHLPFSVLPQLEGEEDEWLPPLSQPLQSNNSNVYKPLIIAHIILLVDNAVSAEMKPSGVINPQINRLLQEAIGKPFYFYTEYNQENKWVSLSSLPDEGNSSWGARPTPYLTNKSSYQIVAAQISQYGSEFNVDIRHYPESQTLYFL